ncbi:hypothetical protein E5358_07115 [Palleniella muris]|uniref:Uncharacterized protein n=2 Tax=Palleniella muris TaxID=3038145 RepID=A0AC61QQH4_9BACT|nr:hypothetical protein E5358_07115 [Palleniella muris]
MLIALCFFVIGAIVGASGPKKRGRAKKNSTDTRVYLQHANEFSYDMYGKHPDAQFVKGNVSFLHKGIVLTCDSALYFQQTNSFEAFGHVKMRQGDTLTLTSDYAYYDGNDEMAEVRHNVILTHRKTKLYCDSLNYDRIYSIGYFFEGGKLVDGETTLTSDWGQYSTADKQAVFYYDVRLKNKTSLTEGDTLYYDTRTSRAHVVGPSKITTKEDVIITEDGYYNSKSDQMELYSRSTINRNDGKVITADSLQHNSNTGISECFGNVEFDDSINKSAFRGDYVYYDENKGYGLATKRAIAMDYSQGDTLYLHGDTMRLFTYNINTDSVYRIMQCSPHVRAYRKDVQAVCDSMVMLSRDSVLIMYKDPILWSDGRQIVGEEIRAYMADSTIRFAHVIGQAFSIEQMPDTVHYNQISSKEMKTYFTDGQLRLNQAEGNVLTLYYAEDSADSTLIGLNYLETDTMRMYFTPARKMDKIWACKHNGVMYPISQIPPDKYFLPGFAWFDYVRPLSKDDILEWRPKKEGMELKKEKRRQAPRNTVATLQKN